MLSKNSIKFFLVFFLTAALGLVLCFEEHFSFTAKKVTEVAEVFPKKALMRVGHSFVVDEDFSHIRKSYDNHLASVVGHKQAWLDDGELTTIYSSFLERLVLCEFLRFQGYSYSSFGLLKKCSFFDKSLSAYQLNQLTSRERDLKIDCETLFISSYLDNMLLIKKEGGGKKRPDITPGHNVQGAGFNQLFFLAEASAHKIRYRLTKKNFKSYAKRYSRAPEALLGGALNFGNQSVWPDVFDYGFSMKAGVISPVIASIYGYHIFMRENTLKPASSFHSVFFQMREREQKSMYQELVKLSFELVPIAVL